MKVQATNKAFVKKEKYIEKKKHFRWIAWDPEICFTNEKKMKVPDFSNVTVPSSINVD